MFGRGLGHDVREANSSERVAFATSGCNWELSEFLRVASPFGRRSENGIAFRPDPVLISTPGVRSTPRVHTVNSNQLGTLWVPLSSRGSYESLRNGIPHLTLSELCPSDGTEAQREHAVGLVTWSCCRHARDDVFFIVSK